MNRRLGEDPLQRARELGLADGSRFTLAKPGQPGLSVDRAAELAAGMFTRHVEARRLPETNDYARAYAGAFIVAVGGAISLAPEFIADPANAARRIDTGAVAAGAGGPGMCSLCDEVHELKPAGEGGAMVCLSCAKKNPAALRAFVLQWRGLGG